MSDARWRPCAVVFRAVNRIVRPVLRSRLHPVLSSRLMLLTYTGARTGRQYAIPIAFYSWEAAEVWAFGARTGWISNLRDGRTVRLRIRGREISAHPTVVEDRESVADLVQELVHRKGPKAIQDPMLGLPRDREPTRDQALTAATKARLVRFHLQTASDSPRTGGPHPRP